jgi:outer membrane lipoprotein-sorting protein
MKNLFATLLTTLFLFLFGQASASTLQSGASALDSLSQPMVCAEEEGKKKKKKGEGDEEPECD